jgi:hypothetical protein
VSKIAIRCPFFQIFGPPADKFDTTSQVHTHFFQLGILLDEPALTVHPIESLRLPHMGVSATILSENLQNQNFPHIHKLGMICITLQLVSPKTVEI